MPKLISADKLSMALRDDPNIPGREFARVKRHIEEAEDEVVLCKDCKYASCNPVKLTYGCQHPSGLRGFLHEGFYFCSFGERRTE